MGLGTMTVPLYVTTLPEGMSLTVDDITKDEPSGFKASISQATDSSWPQTITHSDVTEGYAVSKRGAKVADIRFWTGGSGFGGGQGASVVVKFTISGRPVEDPDAPEQNATGTLIIGNSEWGFFSRPDKTNFVWQIGSQSRTFTAPTPTLTYLDDSCMAVAYAPDDKTYAFGVTNQQDFIVRLMQNAVSGIIAGHKGLWKTAAGMVASIGGVAFDVVSFGVGKLDGI